MPEYLAPGVYTEEIATGPVPIEGVSTSTAGFVGRTLRGSTRPTLTTSWLHFQRFFGGLTDPDVSYMPYAARGFFQNGGQRLYVARVVGQNSGTAQAELAAGGTALTVRALGPGQLENRLFVRVQQPEGPGGQDRRRITVVYYDTAPPTPLVDPLDPRNVRNDDRREPTLVEVFDDLSPTDIVPALRSSSLIDGLYPEGARAELPDVAGYTVLEGGDDGDPLVLDDYRGNGLLPVDQRTGLAGLAEIDVVSLLVIPDEARLELRDLRDDLVVQCEQKKDRFAILQVERGQGLVNGIMPPITTSYAAIYYPWVRTFDDDDDAVLVPPGGHIAGVYAGTDIARGVHKAPANVDLRGILTRDLANGDKPIEFAISKGEHDVLNPRGINVIRDFRADRRGIRVWGARTLSADAQWKYVNVRRLFIFVEESLDEGLQWVVFEPNDEPLWARVRRSISAFLTGVWRSGALMGTTVEEAFFVRCDRTTMTQDDIDNGRLICYIGLAPVKPAEFVVLRFSQKTAEAEA